jgi:hypothetical protein
MNSGKTIFAQLTYRESLRDIEVCLRSAQQKLYHMGIRGKVFRNTLAHTNQVRDWRIYVDFAQILIARDRCLYANDSFGVFYFPFQQNRTVPFLFLQSAGQGYGLFRQRPGLKKL